MKQLAKEWREKYQAPADMEARLVAQFRQVNKRKSGGNWLWWATAMAAVIIVVFSLRPTPERPLSAAQTSATQPVYKAAVVREQPPQIATALTSGSVVKTPTLRSVAKRMTPQIQQTPVEIYTDFFPLEEGDGPIEIDRGRVVRVSMPRVSLLRVGLPVNMDRMDDAVQADLVLNEEGIARAVRFVQ